MLARGHQVWGIDNLHLGRERNIAHLAGNSRLCLRGDGLPDAARRWTGCLPPQNSTKCFTWPPIPISPPAIPTAVLDLRLNQLTTTAVLEAMHRHSVPRLFFSSTSAVFGEQERPLSEE